MKKTIITLTLAVSALSANAASVSIFTGGDAGEGIDFSGNVIHAINLGGATVTKLAPDVTISGLTFKDPFNSGQLITGVTVGYQSIENWGTTPSYGTTANDTGLSAIMHDVSYGANSPYVDFTGLTANRNYTLQVLASDNDSNATRSSSYQLLAGNHTSTTVLDESLNNKLTDLQVAAGGVASNGVVITLSGQADASGNLSLLVPNGTGTGNNDGIANALILTETVVPEPSSAALLGLGGLALILRRRK